jgi:hypothetical protein
MRAARRLGQESGLQIRVRRAHAERRRHFETCHGCSAYRRRCWPGAERTCAGALRRPAPAQHCGREDGGEGLRVPRIGRKVGGAKNPNRHVLAHTRRGRRWRPPRARSGHPPPCMEVRGAARVAWRPRGWWWRSRRLPPWRGRLLLLRRDLLKAPLQQHIRLARVGGNALGWLPSLGREARRHVVALRVAAGAKRRWLASVPRRVELCEQPLVGMIRAVHRTHQPRRIPARVQRGTVAHVARAAGSWGWPLPSQRESRAPGSLAQR